MDTLRHLLGPAKPLSPGALSPITRRTRVLTLAALLFIALFAWYLLWQSAAVMTTMRGHGLLFDLMLAMMQPQMATLYLCAASAMWVVMMLAMMTPAVLPVVATFWQIKRRSAYPMQSHALAFALGYLFVWCLFGVALSVAQWLLHRGAVLSMDMLAAGPVLSAALLIGAGMYQLTPSKLACLRHCQNPLSFLLTHWRDHLTGAARMGLTHGIYCLGCCWALMFLMFVGGVMSVGMMTLISVFILAERLLPASHWVTHVPGLVLVAWGAWLLALTL